MQRCHARVRAEEVAERRCIPLLRLAIPHLHAACQAVEDGQARNLSIDSTRSPVLVAATKHNTGLNQVVAV